MFTSRAQRAHFPRKISKENKRNNSCPATYAKRLRKSSKGNKSWKKTHRDIPVNTEVDFCYDIECKQEKYGDHKKPWRHSNKEEEIHPSRASVIHISSYGECQQQRELYRFK